MNNYQWLNYAEGFLWLVTAMTLRKIILIKKKRHSVACNIAVLGFIIFGISDFIEGSISREFHLWLWILKIGCGIIFLNARIQYIGRTNFKWTDRYLLFFIFCLSLTAVVFYISLQSFT